MHHRSYIELEPLIPMEHLQPVCKILKRRLQAILADNPFLRRVFGCFAAPSPGIEFDIEAVFAAELASAGGNTFEGPVDGCVGEGAFAGVQNDVFLEDVEGEEEVGVGEGA